MLGSRHDQPGRPRQRRRRRSIAVDNTRALGRVLYTQYFYLFQAAGLVLLVAMIGAIVLTLRSRPACAASGSASSSTGPRATPSTVVKVPTRGGRVMVIGLGHYLTVAAVLFTLGIFGIFLNRKNVIVILMSSS